MKSKNVKYILLSIFVLIIAFVLFQYYLKNQKDIDSSNFETYSIESLTTNNFGNDQIEKAITNYLLTKEHFSWKTSDYSHNFCTIENLKPDKELFPLYIWAYCGEYIIQDNELKH